jgi:hypothetical protein
MNEYAKKYYSHIASHLKEVTDTKLRKFIQCLLRRMKQSNIEIYDISELHNRLSERQWNYLSETYLSSKNASAAELRRHIAAWQTGNQIFLNLNQSVTQCTRDFCHEFVHYIRRSAEKPLHDQAHEEMHAFVAEHLVLRYQVPEKSIRQFTKVIWEKVNNPTYKKLKKETFEEMLSHIWLLIQNPNLLIGNEGENCQN